ncbi:hypothetical protein B0H13DRAFT_195031 [Mycena leptocephala]|nr:hypothetical protein B0H13DRAFT_195031 [Mycena leptocephala]
MRRLWARAARRSTLRRIWRRWTRGRCRRTCLKRWMRAGSTRAHSRSSTGIRTGAFRLYDQKFLLLLSTETERRSRLFRTSAVQFEVQFNSLLAHKYIHPTGSLLQIQPPATAPLGAGLFNDTSLCANGQVRFINCKFEPALAFSFNDKLDHHVE